MKNIYIGFFSLVVFFASCSSARKAQKKAPVAVDTLQKEIVENNIPSGETPVENNKNNVSDFVKKINTINYQTFIGKADVDYSGGGKDFSFEAKIQMEKGKVIWISCMGPLGIEIARGIITQDSVHFMNKWEKNYISRSISFLQQQLGLPLTLTDVQDVLIGNAVLIDEKNVSMTENNQQVFLNGEHQRMKTIYEFLMPNALIAKLFVQDKKDANKTATLEYQDYVNSNDVQFSKKRVIDVNDKNKMNVKMKFNSFSLNQNISTPFSIPKSYTKK